MCQNSSLKLQRKRNRGPVLHLLKVKLPCGNTLQNVEPDFSTSGCILGAYLYFLNSPWKWQDVVLELLFRTGAGSSI